MKKIDKVCVNCKHHEYNDYTNNSCALSFTEEMHLQFGKMKDMHSMDVALEECKDFDRFQPKLSVLAKAKAKDAVNNIVMPNLQFSVGLVIGVFVTLAPLGLSLAVGLIVFVFWMTTLDKQ